MLVLPARTENQEEPLCNRREGQKAQRWRRRVMVRTTNHTNGKKERTDRKKRAENRSVMHRWVASHGRVRGRKPEDGQRWEVKEVTRLL